MNKVRKSNVTCATRWCRNKTFGRKYCSTCRAKHSRDNNIEMYAYTTLRNNAKRRRIQFDLTFEQFKEFAYKTNYLAGKGRQKESLTIDRQDNTKGYTISNIKVMTKSENCSKGNRVLIYDWRTGYATVTPPRRKEQTQDNPF